uniref:Semaphorin 4G n=1 Tax=Xiphophorus couchianus TaxID=32473 RepID=A0A3B5L3V2_9TELE
MLSSNGFTGSSQNYSTLLLEEETGRLYVGGRGALYALNTSNISTSANLTVSVYFILCSLQTECYNHIRFLQRFNETHLYVCGTNAFRPLCDTERFNFSSGFEEGRDRCPYDPAKGFTGLLIEADFVGSVLLKESINSSIGDDDKIYFFFTERSQEQIAYPSQTKVSRVARVCKNDWGGQRTLQRKWTTFLKARMVCSVPEYELHLNILRDVFVLQGRDVQSSIFYGVFGLEWKNIKASAICQYTFSDVRRVFEGPYMEVQDSKWREYTGKVPEPRPGSCITDVHRSQGINSSRDLPDSVLTFARRHPLMAKQVHPVDLRPLMFKRSVNYVKIAVHKEPALDENLYTVLFLGTDDGWLHRAVEVDGEMHIIEELQIFAKPQPIESMVISAVQVLTDSVRLKQTHTVCSVLHLGLSLLVHSASVSSRHLNLYYCSKHFCHFCEFVILMMAAGGKMQHKEQNNNETSHKS